MEITSTGQSDLLARSRQTLKLNVASAQPPQDSRPARATEPPEERGLGQLRQELRAVLRQKIAVEIATVVGAYARQSSDADALIGELRAGLGRLTQRVPLEAKETVAALRNVVDDNAKALDDATTRAMTNDLQAAAEDVGRNTESSASVLSSEAYSRQRSSIRIRTQEGDVVRLDFRRTDATSVFDAAVSDSSGSSRLTEVTSTSKSMLQLRVKGDLNADELAAIKSVFSQADAIAEEFFDGDLGAAFNASSSFAFDSEQLAAVKLKFREVETIRASVQTMSTVDAAKPAVVSAPIQEASPESLDQPIEVLQQTPVTTPVVSMPVPGPETTAEPENVADKLGDFLRNTVEAFEIGDGKRYFYSEAFKLSLLQSVIDMRALPPSAADENA